MKYSYVNVTCAYLCWFPFGAWRDEQRTLVHCLCWATNQLASLAASRATPAHPTRPGTPSPQAFWVLMCVAACRAALCARRTHLAPPRPRWCAEVLPGRLEGRPAVDLHPGLLRHRLDCGRHQPQPDVSGASALLALHTATHYCTLSTTPTATAPQDYNEAVFNQQQLDHDATILDDGVNYWQPIGAPEAGAVGQKPHYVQPGAGGRGGGGEALLPAGGGLY